MSYCQVITTCQPPVLTTWHFDHRPTASKIDGRCMYFCFLMYLSSICTRLCYSVKQTFAPFANLKLLWCCGNLFIHALCFHSSPGHNPGRYIFTIERGFVWFSRVSFNTITLHLVKCYQTIKWRECRGFIVWSPREFSRLSNLLPWYWNSLLYGLISSGKNSAHLIHVSS